jgi:hypothetical protein
MRLLEDLAVLSAEAKELTVATWAMIDLSKDLIAVAKELLSAPGLTDLDS